MEENEYSIVWSNTINSLLKDTESDDSDDLIKIIMSLIETLRNRGYNIPHSDWDLFYSIIASMDRFYTGADLPSGLTYIPINSALQLFNYFVDIYDSLPKDINHPIRKMLDLQRIRNRKVFFYKTLMSILHKTSHQEFVTILRLIDIILPEICVEFKMLSVRLKIQFIRSYVNGKTKNKIIRYILNDLLSINKPIVGKIANEISELVNVYYQANIPYSKLKHTSYFSKSSDLGTQSEIFQEEMGPLEFFVLMLSQFLQSTLSILECTNNNDSISSSYDNNNSQGSSSQLQTIDWHDVAKKTNDFIDSINESKSGSAFNVHFIDNNLSTMKYLVNLKNQ
ncbi:hypothetical protein DLAC_05971 [Tieghemostelium lacteum]|uniref:Uncharacterized protein n=1 Tax=Tieghemostelium lacteum TaxID=361077 RepID=A0A151ZH65_TIELA|nr:hypothetical protein DLAC_05971 [Tieghemostelium lacteum]|eukprot:KYQ93306.1 hypothetical protein DLAC_05971 [Tieghemostelium lacteum]